MQEKLQELKDRLVEIDNLNSATAVLGWTSRPICRPAE